VPARRATCSTTTRTTTTTPPALLIPAVRPDDVLTALAAVSGTPMGEAPLMTRLAQGPLEESGTIGDPLA